MADQIVIPLPPHAAAALTLGLVALAAIGLASGFLRGLLGRELRRQRDDFGPAPRAAAALGPAAWAVLLVFALIAAIGGAGRMIVMPGDGGLGTGALVAAVLGVPFVVWATAIRQTTLDYQKEGHVTDCMCKAVEQLGAADSPGGRAERNPAELRGVDRRLPRAGTNRAGVHAARPRVRPCAGGGDPLRRCASNAPAEDAGELPAETAQDRTPHRTAAEAHALARWPETIGSRATRFWHRAQGLPKPRADISLAICVIGRRSRQQRDVEARWQALPEETRHWPFDVDLPEPPELTSSEETLNRNPNRLQDERDAVKNTMPIGVSASTSGAATCRASISASAISRWQISRNRGARAPRSSVRG